MEKAGEKNVASNTQKFEINKLREAMEQQKAELDHLKWLLDNIGTGNSSFLSGIQEIIPHFSLFELRIWRTVLRISRLIQDKCQCSLVCSFYSWLC